MKSLASLFLILALCLWPVEMIFARLDNADTADLKAQEKADKEKAEKEAKEAAEKAKESAAAARDAAARGDVAGAQAAANTAREAAGAAATASGKAGNAAASNSAAEANAAANTAEAMVGAARAINEANTKGVPVDVERSIRNFDPAYTEKNSSNQGKVVGRNTGYAGSVDEVQREEARFEITMRNAGVNTLALKDQEFNARFGSSQTTSVAKNINEALKVAEGNFSLFDPTPISRQPAQLSINLANVNTNPSPLGVPGQNTLSRNNPPQKSLEIYEDYTPTPSPLGENIKSSKDLPAQYAEYGRGKAIADATIQKQNLEKDLEKQRSAMPLGKLSNPTRSASANLEATEAALSAVNTRIDALVDPSVVNQAISVMTQAKAEVARKAALEITRVETAGDTAKANQLANELNRSLGFFDDNINEVRNDPTKAKEELDAQTAISATEVNNAINALSGTNVDNAINRAFGTDPVSFDTIVDSLVSSGVDPQTARSIAAMTPGVGPAPLGTLTAQNPNSSALRTANAIWEAETFLIDAGVSPSAAVKTTDVVRGFIGTFVPGFTTISNAFDAYDYTLVNHPAAPALARNSAYAAITSAIVDIAGASFANLATRTIASHSRYLRELDSLAARNEITGFSTNGTASGNLGNTTSNSIGATTKNATDGFSTTGQATARLDSKMETVLSYDKTANTVTVISRQEVPKVLEGRISYGDRVVSDPNINHANNVNRTAMGEPSNFPGKAADDIVPATRDRIDTTPVTRTGDQTSVNPGKAADDAVTTRTAANDNVSGQRTPTTPAVRETPVSTPPTNGISVVSVARTTTRAALSLAQALNASTLPTRMTNFVDDFARSLTRTVSRTADDIAPTKISRTAEPTVSKPQNITQTANKNVTDPVSTPLPTFNEVAAKPGTVTYDPVNANSPVTPTNPNTPSYEGVENVAITPQPRPNVIDSIGNAAKGAANIARELIGIKPAVSQPIGITQNNPTNIRESVGNKDANHWVGEVDDGVSAFETFESPEYGFRAQIKLQKKYQDSYNAVTIRQRVERATPLSENPVQPQYVARVAEHMGIGPDEPFDINSKELAIKYLEAVTREEVGAQYPREVMERGFDLAQGNSPSVASNAANEQLGDLARTGIQIFRAANDPTVIAGVVLDVGLKQLERAVTPPTVQEPAPAGTAITKQSSVADIKNFWGTRILNKSVLYDKKGNPRVNPDILHAAAMAAQRYEQLHPGYTVKVISGHRPLTGKKNQTKNHTSQADGYGGALDFSIIDPSGRNLQNHNSVIMFPGYGKIGDTAPMYQEYYNEVVVAMQHINPDRVKQLRSGAYFKKGTHRMDAMHIDITTPKTEGGNTLEGFTDFQMREYNISKNNGLVSWDNIAKLAKERYETPTTIATAPVTTQPAPVVAVNNDVQPTVNKPEPSVTVIKISTGGEEPIVGAVTQPETNAVNPNEADPSNPTITSDTPAVPGRNNLDNTDIPPNTLGQPGTNINPSANIGPTRNLLLTIRNALLSLLGLRPAQVDKYYTFEDVELTGTPNTGADITIVNDGSDSNDNGDGAGGDGNEDESAASRKNWLDYLLDNESATSTRATTEEKDTVNVLVQIDGDTGDMYFDIESIVSNGEIYYKSTLLNDDEEETEASPHIVLNDQRDSVVYSDGTYAPVVINGVWQQAKNDPDYVYIIEYYKNGQPVALSDNAQTIPGNALTNFLSSLFTSDNSYDNDGVHTITRALIDPNNETPADEYYAYRIYLRNGDVRGATVPQYTSYAYISQQFRATGFTGDVLQLVAQSVEIPVNESRAVSAIAKTLRQAGISVLDLFRGDDSDKEPIVTDFGTLVPAADGKITMSDIKAVTVLFDIEAECPDAPGLQIPYLYEVIIDQVAITEAVSDQAFRAVRCGGGDKWDYVNQIASHFETFEGAGEIDRQALYDKITFGSLADLDLQKLLAAPEKPASVEPAEEPELKGENEEPEEVFVPNRTNSINFEMKAVNSEGQVISDWSANSKFTISPGVQLYLRWQAPDYQQCLPFFQDNGNYALTRSNHAMLSGNTETERYNLTEKSGVYRIECGGQSNKEFGVDERGLEILVQ